jgi:hypothetical protein
MAAISLAPNGLLKILGLAGRLAGKEASKEPDGVEARLSAGADSRHPSSDPASSNSTDKKPIRPVDRKPAEVDQANVDKLAEEVRKKHADLGPFKTFLHVLHPRFVDRRE